MSVSRVELVDVGSLVPYEKVNDNWVPKKTSLNGFGFHFTRFSLQAVATKFPTDQVSCPAWGFDGEVYDPKTGQLHVVTISLTKEQAQEIGRLFSDI